MRTESISIFPEPLARKEIGVLTAAAKRELAERDTCIYCGYLAGTAIAVLAEKYFLAPKNIQRIIGQLKKKHKYERKPVLRRVFFRLDFAQHFSQ